MILPIRVFGDPALRQTTEPVEHDSDELQALLDDMIETMRSANGIGLAAPQVGRSERLFVIDLAPMAAELEEEGETIPPQPMILINPEIEHASRATCRMEEGCLSIPDVREMVQRPETVRLRYLDRDLEEQQIEAEGFLARVLQHEHDHLDGVLFTDYLSAFRKRLLKRQLRAMKEGNAEADYPLASDAEHAPA